MSEQVNAPGGDVWEFDFAKWTLDDVLAFETARNLKERLPMMAKALLRNPYNVDLGDPKQYKNLNGLQWAAIQKKFIAAVEATFQ